MELLTMNRPVNIVHKYEWGLKIYITSMIFISTVNCGSIEINKYAPQPLKNLVAKLCCDNIKSHANFSSTKAITTAIAHLPHLCTEIIKIEFGRVPLPLLSAILRHTEPIVALQWASFGYNNISICQADKTLTGWAKNVTGAYVQTSFFIMNSDGWHNRPLKDIFNNRFDSDTILHQNDLISLLAPTDDILSAGWNYDRSKLALGAKSGQVLIWDFELQSDLSLEQLVVLYYIHKVSSLYHLKMENRAQEVQEIRDGLTTAFQPTDDPKMALIKTGLEWQLDGIIKSDSWGKVVQKIS